MKKRLYNSTRGKLKKSLWLGLLVIGIIAFSACEKHTDDDNQYKQIRPKGPKPVWAPTITPQMQTVIETLDTISPIPLYTLTPHKQDCNLVLPMRLCVS